MVVSIFFLCEKWLFLWEGALQTSLIPGIAQDGCCWCNRNGGGGPTAALAAYSRALQQARRDSEAPSPKPP